MNNQNHLNEPPKKLRDLFFSSFVFFVATMAFGGVTATYEEVAGTVVFTASGSINTGDLTETANTATGAFVSPNAGLLQSNGAFLWSAAGFSGPSSFGTAGFTSGTSTGNTFGVREPGSFAGGGINLPSGYVSGTPISGTLTVTGSIASLGLLPTVTYTWGTGPNADFFTIRDVSVPVELVSFSVE